MKTEVYTDPQAFLEAVQGKKRTKRGRPDLPAAGRAESIGLGPLIVKGWSTEFCARRGYRMYRIGGQSTGYFPDEKAACLAAKELER